MSCSCPQIITKTPSLTVQVLYKLTKIMLLKSQYNAENIEKFSARVSLHYR